MKIQTMKKPNSRWGLMSSLVLMVFLISSCGGDGGGDDTPPVPEPVSSFTYEADEENTLAFTFTNTSEEAVTYSWDFGDGSTSTDKDPTHEYDAAGTYTVSLTVSNEGGSDESSQDIEAVEPDDGNLIEGGSMDDPGAWTITKANYDLVTDVEIADGKMVFSNNPTQGETHVSVWQAVEVEAGDYLFSAIVSGSAENALNSWVQLHFGRVEPAEGVDYNESPFTGINTWDGCMNEPFDADIADIGCKLTSGEPAPLIGTEGIVTFEEAGTVYVTFKAGSCCEGYLGDGGVTLDDVSLFKVE